MARIYSETLPFERVVEKRTLDLLRRYSLEIVLAVRPWQMAELGDVARALRDGGIPVSIWPMVGDDEGRWASAHNAEAFAIFVQRTVEGLVDAGAPPRDLLLDLEPPFSDAKALEPNQGKEGIFRIATGVVRPASQKVMASARARLAQTVVDLRAHDITTSMAVWPLVALDPPGASPWQALLGTPVDGLDADHVSVMMYTSILEGWSRGALRRDHAAALLAKGTARVARRFGERAGISLGCVGTGAFEHEPIYRSPSELAADAAIARAMGIDKLALFDLGGVLARGPAEAWLDAFTETSALEAEPRIGHRIAAARTLARAATWALGRRR